MTQFWKLFGLLFRNDYVEAAKPVVKEIFRERQFGNADGERNDIYNMTGTVTNMCDEQSYGLINKGIFFKYDIIVGHEDLKVGDQVIVSAKRKNKACGFIASSVALHHTNWDTNTSSSATNNKSSQRLLIENFNPEHIKVIDGFVTELHEQFGTLDKRFKFYLGDRDSTADARYHPSVGDRISGSLISWDCEERVIAWKPTTVKTVDGIVTLREVDWGVIDNNIVFFVQSCYCNFPLREELKLQAHIVESKNPPCFTWRAFSLALESEEECLKPIRSESDDLYIEGDSDFGEVTVGKVEHLQLVIKNNQNTSLSIVGIRFKKAVDKCPFVVSDISNKVIPGNFEASIKVSCKAASVGKNSDLLVFEFGEFLLTRDITVNVVDPAQNFLHATAPYQPRCKQQVTFGDLSSKVIIPGRKSFNPKANFKGHGPSFQVPAELRSIINTQNNLPQIAPVLFKELNCGTYCRKFHTLLHLEEIQMGVDISEFGMTEVVLQHNRSFLVLEVPGLAEGRPSLLIGDKAMLYPPNSDSNLVYEGYIHEVCQNVIYLKFHQDFHGKYDGETFNVTFEFNRSNMKRCHQCLSHVYNSSSFLLFPEYVSLKKPLIKICSDKSRSSKFSQDGINIKWQNPILNSQQKIAVIRILRAECRPLPYIIFGPPGTGKTVTLVESVLQIYLSFKNARILICTPTNSAADLFAKLLLDSKILGHDQLVRLNSYQRAVESIPDFIKPFCQNKDSVMKIIKYPIILSTWSTAGILYNTDMPSNHFTHVFIDEACQLTEPETMVAIGIISTHNNGSLVMAGDPKQLGSVVQSPLAKTYGLNISYMERLMQFPLYMRNEAKFSYSNGYNPNLVTMLIDCYRMHPYILQFPSTTFYNSQLRCCVPKERHSLIKDLDILPTKGFPIIFHGVQGSEEREEMSPSWFNSTEIVLVVQYLRRLYANNIDSNDIGIITPYRKQVEKIRQFIQTFNLDLCKIGSVEEFQGQERKVILISAVRSHKDYIQTDVIHNIGFLCSPKRFNVAITRAQELLIVIGNPVVLSQDDNWAAFITYCQINGGFTEEISHS